MATNFHTLPAEIQAIVVLKALEVSPNQDKMRLSKLPLYEQATTFRLASVSTAFLDHVVVACRSKCRFFLYSFMWLIENCPQKQEGMVCKYVENDKSNPLASMQTLERALPTTAPLFRGLHCEHCDMVEKYEKAIVVWSEELRLLCAQSDIVEELLEEMEKMRLQIGIGPPPGSRRPSTDRAMEFRMTTPVPPVRQ